MWEWIEFILGYLLIAIPALLFIRGCGIVNDRYDKEGEEE
jgi:hypothetical protein